MQLQKFTLASFVGKYRLLPNSKIKKNFLQNDVYHSKVTDA